MSVKSANLGPTATSAVLATGPSTLHNIHWVTATSSAGSIQLHDGTATTADLKLVLDTPQATNKGAGSSLKVGGGGLRFSTAIFAKKTNSGGVTIVYATGV